MKHVVARMELSAHLIPELSIPTATEPPAPFAIMYIFTPQQHGTTGNVWHNSKYRQLNYLYSNQHILYIAVLGTQLFHADIASAAFVTASDKEKI